MSTETMTAESLYHKYKELLALSKTNLNTVPLNVRAGREGQIRAAAEESLRVAKEYRELVTQNSVMVAITGPFSQSFAEILQKEHGFLALNYQKAADVVAERVIERGYPDRYDSRTFHMAMDEVLRIKSECGIFSTPQLQQLNTTGLLSLKDGMRQTIKKSMGGQLYTLVTKNDIGLAALQNEFTGNHIPVVLYNYDVDAPIDPTFFKDPVTTIDCTQESDATSDKAKEFISEIKQKVFGNTEKTTKKQHKRSK